MHLWLGHVYMPEGFLLPFDVHVSGIMEHGAREALSANHRQKKGNILDNLFGKLNNENFEIICVKQLYMLSQVCCKYETTCMLR